MFFWMIFLPCFTLDEQGYADITSYAIGTKLETTEWTGNCENVGTIKGFSPACIRGGTAGNLLSC